MRRWAQADKGWWGVVSIFLCIQGCSCGSSKLKWGDPCTSMSECGSGLVCVGGFCAETLPGGGYVLPDGGYVLPDGGYLLPDGGSIPSGGSQHIVPDFCPGCPAFPGTPADGGLPAFGDLGNPPSCTGTGVNPTLVYPNDGALFPPNMNVVEIQFLPGSGNQVFEIDFENALTDVRVETRCNAITNTVGTATGGCGLTLDPTTWSYIAANNAGGSALTVTVRGAPSDTSCVAGSNSRTMLFASQNVQGAI